MKLKANGILIDLDGTLVDSKEAYREALKITFNSMKLKDFSINMAFEIPRRLEQSLPISDLIPKGQDKSFLGNYLKAYYSLTESKTRPLPNVSKTLEKLSTKSKLALITMRYVSKEKVRKELENFNFAQYFHCMVTALDASIPKPSPEAVIKCAQQLGVKTGECVVVGDSIADIKAGKRAGASTVAVLSGIFKKEELAMEKPDLILESINMLPDFVT